MKQNYQLIDNFIEKGMLHLTLKLSGDVYKDKPRIIAVFRDEVKDRRIPLEVVKQRETGTWIVKGQVQLNCVFFTPVQGEQVTVSLEVQQGVQAVPLEEETLCYAAKHFSISRSEETLGGALGRFLLFCVTVPLLPCFLLHGLFAYLGFFSLDIGENTSKGKKAILIHANVLTKKISGFSYSKREWKIHLLRFFYERGKQIPVNEKMILLLSERKVEIGGNMDCVRAALLKRIEQEALDIQLVEEFTPATIDRLSFRQIRQCAKKIATAGTIVLEDFYPQLHQLKIRQETTIIQLWHACGAFKTFGFSRLGKPGGALQNSPNHRNYHYAMVSGNSLKPIYGEAFGIPEQQVQALGVPRTDRFFQPEREAEIKKGLYQTYPQLEHKKVVLFAPTFRGDGNKDAYYPQNQFHPEQWLMKLPEDYVVLIKHHPFIKQTSIIKENPRILDLSNGENINDLLFVTDYLVTDYSSVIFEGALRNIPMIFYGFDWREYMESRDIYGTYEQFIPGPLVETEEELLACINDFPKKNYLETFRETYLDALDGHSTERVVSFIMNCVTGDIE